jgi:hypothetical protein
MYCLKYLFRLYVPYYRDIYPHITHQLSSCVGWVRRLMPGQRNGPNVMLVTLGRQNAVRWLVTPNGMQLAVAAVLLELGAG